MNEPRNEPDWDKMRALHVEIERLQEEGKWDQKAFLRILGEATKASNGYGVVMESFINEAEESWLKGRLTWG